MINKLIKYSVAVFLLFALVCFCDSCGSNSKTVNNTISTEETNTGTVQSFYDSEDIDLNYVKEAGEKIFYISGGNVCQYDKTTHSRGILIEQGDIDSIDFENDILYYHCSDEDIIKAYNIDNKTSSEIMKLNEKDTETISESTHLYSRDIDLSDFFVHNGEIFVNEALTLWRFDPKTDTLTEFIGDFSPDGAFDEEWYYYTDHGEKTFSVWRKNLNDGKVELVCGDGKGKRHTEYEGMYDELWFDNVLKLNGNLYFCSRIDASIYSYDGTNINEILDCRTEFINDAFVSGDKIYYSVDEYLLLNKSSGTRLYSFDPVSGQVESVSDMVDGNSHFYVVDGEVIIQ